MQLLSFHIRMTISSAVIAYLTAEATGQSTHFGPCPITLPVSNFTDDLFLGTWYEIAKFPNRNEGDLTCCQTVISAKVDFGYLLRSSGKKGSLGYRTALGYAKPKSDSEANFKVVFDQYVPVPIPVSVLATDYKQYAAVFACLDAKVFNIQYLWILSRERTLDESILAQVKNKLDAYDIDIHALKMNEQVHC